LHVIAHWIARDCTLDSNVLIGAGRQVVGEELSFSGGVLLHKKVGGLLREGELLFTLFAEVGGGVCCQIGTRAPSFVPAWNQPGTSLEPTWNRTDHASNWLSGARLTLVSRSAPAAGSKRRIISEAEIDAACARIMAAYKFGPAKGAPPPSPLIKCYIDGKLNVHPM
jgi:hypothetical protein